MTDEITALVEISNAEQALQRADEIQDIVLLRDKASAFQLLANAQGFKEAAQKAKIFQLKAERKAGDWLAENVRPGNPQLYQDGIIETLPEGITLNESSRWQQEAKVPEEKFNEWVDDCLSTGKEISAAGLQRLSREEYKAETPQLPSDKYRVFYADPPWQYNSGDQHTNEAQATVLGTHYPSMSTPQLCEMPVKNISQDNSVLFIWVTSPLLEECFSVINAWGFQYKTSIVWNKESHNVGYYVSVRHEFLLICTKGSCRPDIDKLLPSVVSEKRTEHSAKPEIFRSMIDEMYPVGKRIELFARTKHEGWEVWGNEPAVIKG